MSKLVKVWGELTRNAKLVIVVAALQGMSDSVWSGTVCAAYLYALTGNNVRGARAAHRVGADGRG